MVSFEQADILSMLYARGPKSPMTFKGHFWGGSLQIDDIFVGLMCLALPSLLGHLKQKVVKMYTGKTVLSGHTRKTKNWFSRPIIA